MRKLVTILSLLTLGGSALAAQGFWHPELGVQGGYASVKPSGTGQDDATNFLNFPGPVFFSGVLTYGALYGIIPVGNKLAVEPSLNFAQVDAGGSFTSARLGLRLNYALGAHLYAAAGGSLGYLEGGGTGQAQLGLQAALGYRTALSGTLNGRIEFQYANTQNTDQIEPANTYALLAGVSARLDGPSAPSRGGASGGAWRPQVGVQGGYSRSHVVGGGGDVTSLSLPGIGGALTGIGIPVVGGTTLFAVLPVSNKLAIEPGFGYDRAQSGGQTIAAVNLSARLNYALVGGLYGAAGGNFALLHATGNDNGTVTGGQLGVGYRFGMAGPFGGRVEANYIMMGDDPDLGIPALNTFGVLFGLTMPLK